VLNHYDEEQTNATTDILRTGFTTNQKIFLERIHDKIQKEKKK